MKTEDGIDFGMTPTNVKVTNDYNKNSSVSYIYLGIIYQKETFVLENYIKTEVWTECRVP